MIIGIDGRCAAGKTTLAATLAQKVGAQIVHMDDFFLRPEQRTDQRLAEPGGNVDRERVESQVLKPLHDGRTTSYQPWNCRALCFEPAIELDPHAPLTIVEGSYALHPELRGYYDLTMFVDVDPAEQRRRLEARNAALLRRFLDEWIPMEERYFTSTDTRRFADITLSLNGEPSGEPTN
ncbi:uridine kinase family protein [Bifidobacterium oedipodis]|uniref:Phosphoribulokinase n=1 Tax=Bifidobacterium oedipodis TaxID=2675322 RepID=A0A7Y0HRY2_9BIFI|nr:phosphoribulokinase [Bifidobacterium sp. DSM 109957]NMM92988.1 phosphoribulokinase [Bifidobacterium sp. DSM 109957]